MKNIYMLIALILSIHVSAFAKAAEKKTGQRMVVNWKYLEKFEKNEEALSRRANRIKSSTNLREALLQADARKIGPGTLLIEHTAGMLNVKRAVYSVRSNDTEVDLVVRRINCTNDTMIVDLPGWSGETIIDDERSVVIMQAEALDKHVLKLTEKYGKATASEKGTQHSLSRTEVLKWNVGDGYLEVEVSSSAGIVDSITYVVGDQKDKSQKKLKVKNVDLTKGEMTIELPGYTDDEGKRLPGK